jgi:Ribbon-helix-helix domain
VNNSLGHDYIPEPERNRGGRPLELGLASQRFVLTFTSEEYAALKAMSKRSHVPMTRLVRHALQRYLRERGY